MGAESMRKKHTGEPGNGGQFAGTHHAADEVTLSEQMTPRVTARQRRLERERNEPGFAQQRDTAIAVAQAIRAVEPAARYLQLERDLDNKSGFIPGVLITASGHIISNADHIDGLYSAIAPLSADYAMKWDSYLEQHLQKQSYTWLKASDESQFPNWTFDIEAALKEANRVS